MALWLLWFFGHSHSSLAFLFCKSVLLSEAVAQGCSTTSIYFGNLNVRLLSLVRIEAIFLAHVGTFLAAVIVWCISALPVRDSGEK